MKEDLFQKAVQILHKETVQPAHKKLMTLVGMSDDND